MKVSLPGMFKQIARDCPHYACSLEELERHLRETISGEHTLSEFGEFYCLNEAQKPDAGSLLSGLRAAGWHIGVHNDYRLDGKWMTFWLLTHSCGKYVKGEGETDVEALRQCDEQARKMFEPSP
jgi:hypothetical protein